MSNVRIKSTFMYTGIFAAALLFFVFIYRCPIYAIFGFQCPGCGITRAYIAASQLNFSAAFSHHPLFFVAAPLVGYIVFRNKLMKPLSGKTETAILIVVSILFTGVYIYRVLNGNFTV